MDTRGQIIRDWRRAAGMSQAELSVAVGVSVPTVSQWESGKFSPTPANLDRVARACGVTLLAVCDDRGTSPRRCSRTARVNRFARAAGLRVSILGGER